MIKLNEIYAFILSHPTCDKVFPVDGWTSSDILTAIHDSNTVGGLFHYKENHKVEGIMITFPNPNNKILWVTALIANGRKAFRALVANHEQHFKDYVVWGKKHGRIRPLNTKRMLELI